MISIDWAATYSCNFHCKYCFPSISIKKNKESPPIDGNEIADKFLKFSENMGQKLHITISGGEPFLLKDFVDLCEKLVYEGNLLTIFTNLSIREKIEDFNNRVSSYGIDNLDAALHIEERERKNNLDDYITDFIKLKENGFNISSTYVLHPTLMERFDDDLELLYANNITPVNTKVFKGQYNGKFFPEGYTEEEKIKIMRHTDNNYFEFTRGYLEQELKKHGGQPCYCGITGFKVEVDGTLKRCGFVNRTYGNIFEGHYVTDKEPLPCPNNEGFSITWCGKHVENKE
ncbi:MAG: radical SAM protein [bacterium]